MPRTGRRPGPSGTRERIIAAAADRFAAAGYETTSMRQVAADAGVDPALVRRFYGTKERLFTEVAAALIGPEAALAAVLEGPPGQAGERLARYFLGLLGEVQRPGPLLGLIRSAVTSEHAAGVLRAFLAGRLHGAIAGTLRADHADLRAALVASQLVGLAVTRYAVRLGPLAGAGADELAGWVGPVLQHYLDGGHPGEAAPARDFPPATPGRRPPPASVPRASPVPRAWPSTPPQAGPPGAGHHR
jgi:AcrR family transcriptional regulator